VTSPRPTWLELYDAVVYAVGAQTDRHMGIPGENLPGSWPATEFVAWYNGHPDYQDLEFDLSGRCAVVVGAGNVALDVVRMLALAPEEILPTDTTDAAIEAILGSGIEEIVLLARRGPAQAAFTTPELKELGEMADADVVVDPRDLELDPTSEASLEHDTNARRNVEVLREYAARKPAGKRRTIRLRFCVSPVEIVGRRRVEGIEVVPQPAGRRRLGAVERRTDGRARDDSVRDRLPQRRLSRCRAARMFRFDARRAPRFPNENGRVTACPGVYCAGWIKRGPSGVIGTNKKDGPRPVDLLLEDARAGCCTGATPAATAGDGRAAARRPPRRPRHLCGGRRSNPRSAAAGRPHGRPRSSCHLG
jgi:ferredoxin--NADP+ reductase